MRCAFIDFFETLEEEDCKVVDSNAESLESEDEDGMPVRLEIVDYDMLYGYLSMSRE